MNPETAIQRRIMLELSAAGVLIFRNESAGAWVGKVVHRSGDQVTLSRARMIQAGLTTGSSDLIGCAPGGRFLACEVKTGRGRATIDQELFIRAVLDHGGIAGIARSERDALDLLMG